MKQIICAAIILASAIILTYLGIRQADLSARLSNLEITQTGGPWNSAKARLGVEPTRAINWHRARRTYNLYYFPSLAGKDTIYIVNEDQLVENVLRGDYDESSPAFVKDAWQQVLNPH